MKILMVDDDVEITKAVETVITSMGHDFQFTNDPREGLKLNYHILILLSN